MSTFGWQTCGYGCGQPWRPFNGTKLIGHARCALSEAGQDDLLKRMEHDPHLTQAELAEEYHVTAAVIRAWQRLALQRRAERRKHQGQTVDSGR